MKNKLIVIGFLAAVLALSSCIFLDGDGSYYTNNSGGNFHSYLRGTWEINEVLPYYKNATVKIERNSIDISGVNIPPPLTGFTPLSLLNGYSEEESNVSGTRKGKIYIQDKGEWQNPIDYTYWETAFPQREKRLTIKAPPGYTDFTLFFKK